MVTVQSTKEDFHYLKAKKGSYKNPILKNGDYIFIGNNLLNNTSELVQEVTAPINSIITPYLFYRSLTD